MWLKLLGIVVKSPRRSYLLMTGALLIGLLVVCTWAAIRLDWALVWKQLHGADATLEIGMGATWILALCFRPLRLMVLIRALVPQARPRYATIWSTDIIAMAINSVVPMRAGDIMMAVSLRQSLDISMARATSVMLMDRFFDFATVMVIFATTLSVVPTTAAWTHQALVVVLAAMFLLSGGLWLAISKRKFWISLLNGLSELTPSPHVKKWIARGCDLFEGFAHIDSFKVVSAAALVSACQWGTIATSYWFGINGVWPHAGFAGAAFAASAVALSFIVPIAPGGFGVFHGVVVLALGLFAVPVEPAFAFAIVAHALQMGSVLMIGVFSLLAQGIKLRSLFTIQNAEP
jgi:uncharacterized protein (TIRG00374 family)